VAAGIWARTSRIENLESQRKLPQIFLIIEWPVKWVALAFYECDEYRLYRQNRALRPDACPFCELLPPKIKHGETDLFLLGLLSLMDSILEIPMSEVLEKVPIDRETRAVLLGGNSHLGPLYQLMLAQESGDWRHSAELAKSLNLQESEVAGVYWEAMQWARKMTSSA
jgi:c-di-GMP-related signal transduction protein